MATGFRNLLVYQKAFSLAMDIYKASKAFPKDEQFGLISQIRNCSRSVCASIGEGYRKRKYPAHFVSKMTDSDMENSEIQVWLDFALFCEYIPKTMYDDFNARSEEIGRLLNYMIENPDKYK
ncbi:MAG: four helix bundle protein [Bacteroidota bacterium]